MQINLSHSTPNRCLYLWQAENEGAGLYFSVKGQDDGCVCCNEFCLGCAGFIAAWAFSSGKEQGLL